MAFSPPLTEQVPQTLHAAFPVLARVPVYPAHSVCVHKGAHMRTHAHMLPFSLFSPISDPEPRAALSAQYPGLMGASQMPACWPPRSLPPMRGLRAKPGRPWEPPCWLLPWLCSHNHCNHSAMLGIMPLWEPPPHDLDCPLALPGEGEARMGAQRDGQLPPSLKGPSCTPPGG